MTNKKMTKKEFFNSLKAKYPLTVEEIERLDHEIELLDKKNASGGNRKPTKTQLANQVLADSIYNAMEKNVGYTISEMIKKFNLVDSEGALLSTSKVSAVVRTRLVETHRVERAVVKGKTIFTKVED